MFDITNTHNKCKHTLRHSRIPVWVGINQSSETGLVPNWRQYHILCVYPNSATTNLLHQTKQGLYLEGAWSLSISNYKIVNWCNNNTHSDTLTHMHASHTYTMQIRTLHIHTYKPHTQTHTHKNSSLTFRSVIVYAVWCKNYTIHHCIYQ